MVTHCQRYLDRTLLALLGISYVLVEQSPERQDKSFIEEGKEAAPGEEEGGGRKRPEAPLPLTNMTALQELVLEKSPVKVSFRQYT